MGLPATIGTLITKGEINSWMSINAVARSCGNLNQSVSNCIAGLEVKVRSETELSDLVIQIWNTFIDNSELKYNDWYR